MVKQLVAHREDLEVTIVRYVLQCISIIHWQHNKHPVGCEAQLAWKCLFTPIFFGGRFWLIK